MGELTSISTYPLSGARSQALNRAAVGVAGIPGDRQYVAYDPGRFTEVHETGGNPVQAHLRISQKRYGAMALVSARYDAGGDLVIAQDAVGAFTVPSPRSTVGKRVFVNEFGDATPCWEVGRQASECLTQMLGGKAVALARKTDEWARGGVIPPSERAVAPLHIVNQASVDALQEMSQSRGMTFGAERFRSNVVVNGFDAFEETSWIGRDVNFGGLSVRISRPTARCKVTGIDQADGQLLGDVPLLLHELKELNAGGKGMADFGVYAYPLIDNGQFTDVTVGDKVEVI